jgi:hypothetical protein
VLKKQSIVDAPRIASPIDTSTMSLALPLVSVVNVQYSKHSSVCDESTFTHAIHISLNRPKNALHDRASNAAVRCPDFELKRENVI